MVHHGIDARKQTLARQPTRPLTTEPRSGSDRVVHARRNEEIKNNKGESSVNDPVATAPRFCS